MAARPGLPVDEQWWRLAIAVAVTVVLVGSAVVLLSTLAVRPDSLNFESVAVGERG